MEDSGSSEPTSTSTVRPNQQSIFADNGRKNTSDAMDKHEHSNQMTCDSTLKEAPKDANEQQPPIDPKDITIRPPPAFRCPGRGRWTNQLKYLLNTVIKPILNLKCSRYFKSPVDPITLRVPNYYDIITNPMDLGTIKKRLENNYYINAQECIDDVNLVLRNCYTFNKPEHFVFLEGRQMEDQFKKRIGKMPFDEEEIPFALKAGSFASPKKKSVPNVTTTKLVPRASTDPVTTVVQQTEAVEADSASPNIIEPHPSPPPLEDARTPQPFMTADDELSEEALQPPPLTPAPIIDEEAVSNDSSSQAVSQSGLPSLECADSRTSPDCPVTSAADDTAVVHSTQEDEPLDLATESNDVSKPLVVSVEESKDDDFSASDTSVAMETNEIPEVSTKVITSSIRPPFAVQPSKTKKGVKRKADTTTPNTPGPWKSGSIYNEDLMGTARTSTRKIKPPNKELPGEDEPFGKAFKKSPLNSQLRFCSNLIKELLGKSHYEYAWPFHEPVDVEKWNLPDYLEKIKRPMDLGTVKKKIDNRLYKSPSEFAADVRLIFSNCYQYNPSDNPVYIMAQRLHNVFESKFAKLPSKSPSSPVSTGAYASNNHHNRHNHLNHHHNHHHHPHRTPTSTVTSSHSSTPSSASHPTTGATGGTGGGSGSSKSGSLTSGKPNKKAATATHSETRSSSSSANHTDSRKSGKYHKNTHTPNSAAAAADESSVSVSSSNSQHKSEAASTPVNSAPKPAPKPQPEYPDANTIAALQQQLQAVMHQLAVIQNRGLQSDDKERDANNIQTKLNNLTGAQKKPRAPKKPRKSKVSDTQTAAAAETSSASADDLNATSSSVSTAAAATTTLPKLEPGATETNSNSHIKTEQMSPQGAITNTQSSATTNSMTSTVSSTVPAFAASDPSDLGPGQLPLTTAPPSSSSVSSSTPGAAASQPSSFLTGAAAAKVNANSSATINHTSATGAADYQQANNQSSGNTVTPPSQKGNRKRGKAANESAATSTNQQSVKKSTLKKTTKMSRPQDNKLLDSDEEENATDMTYEEKRQLSSNIDRLTKPQLYRVVHILRAHEPQLQNADVAEITLDLETVKAVTLRALEKFVNQCLKSKKPRAVPPPKKLAPPPVETLPLREYESRKEELVRKIEELGGKKTSKTYEKELGEGYNLDPVNRGISRLSDGSSSEDSDSSSSDGGSSDSDDSRDDSSDNSDSPQGGPNSATGAGANRSSAAAALSSKNAKRKSSPHKHSQLINNGAKHFQPHNSTGPKTGGPVVGSAFANLAVGLVNSGSRNCSPKSAISSPTSSFDKIKESGGSTGAGVGPSNSISANVTKVLSTWGSANFSAGAQQNSNTTSSVSSSAAATSSVNSSLLFQQYKKQALERTQMENQIKAKQKLNEISRKPLESSKAPNLSESEDEAQPNSLESGKSSNKGLNDATDGFGSKSSPPHVVDLNEQMNLLDSFEKSTTSMSLSSPTHF